jgi:hypothetical protein
MEAKRVWFSLSFGWKRLERCRGIEGWEVVSKRKKCIKVNIQVKIRVRKEEWREGIESVVGNSEHGMGKSWGD